MSDSSYINKGNFRYGITEYDQPCIPQYNSTLHHKKHGIREFPNNAIRDDGQPYRAVVPLPACCKSCRKCNGIIRHSLMNNLVNIETSITKVLTITLYGTTKDLDKTIKMVVGNKYCVTYITEQGPITVSGKLTEISTNIPDDCTKYIGNFSSVTTAAWIGLDCSTDGSSDKRLIYIASIRYIEELFDDNQDHYPTLSSTEKLELMLTKLTTSLATIEEYIASNNEDNNDTNNNDTDINENESDNNTNDIVPTPHPHHHMHHRPLIDPHHHGHYIPYPPYLPYLPKELIDKLKNDGGKISMDITTDLLDSMKDIKNLLNSYIVECSNTSRNDLCDDCDMGVPIVDKVPYDAVSKDLYVVEDPDTDPTNDTGD